MAHHITPTTTPDTPASTTNKTVCIIGGSFSGLTCARYIHKHYNDLNTNDNDKLNVVLIEPNQYFEYVPGILRCYVKPEHHKSICAEYAQLPTVTHAHTSVIHDTATHLDTQSQAIKLQQHTKQTIKYDYLVLALGSDYDRDSQIRPGDSAHTCKERYQQIKSQHHQINKCTDIHIFGAGLVGVELAAELLQYTRHTHVTLYSLDPTILPDMPSTAQQYAHKWLTSYGTKRISIVVNNTVKPADFKKNAQSNNTLVYVCTGSLPSRVVPAINQDDKSVCDSHQWYHIDDYLHLRGQQTHKNVFVIGDCSAATAKYAYYSELNAEYVGEAILRDHTHQQNALRPFPDHFTGSNTPLPSLISISLGSKYGIVIFNDLVLCGLIGGVVKWFIEVSKVGQYKEQWLSTTIWTTSEPVVLKMNWAYHRVKRWWKGRQD